MGDIPNKSLSKLAELLEMQSEMFKKFVPESDEMDRYEDIRLELAAELEELENQQPKDSITEELVRKIVNRSKEGEITYGYSMDREDYSREQWLIELISELTDGAIYATKLLAIERAKNEPNDVVLPVDPVKDKGGFDPPF